MTESQTTYKMPYSDGLVPNTCMNCMSMNDNWEYEVGEMCKRAYEGTCVLESRSKRILQFGIWYAKEYLLLFYLSSLMNNNRRIKTL